MLTQTGVKQLTDFLRTVTAASDLVDCTLVNCDTENIVCTLCTPLLQFYAIWKRNFAGVWLMVWKYARITFSQIDLSHFSGVI